MVSISRTRIGIIIGLSLIIAVASMMGIPFMEQGMTMKKTQQSIKNFEKSEEIMLNFIEQEKAELESKIGGKLNIP